MSRSRMITTAMGRPKMPLTLDAHEREKLDMNRDEMTSLLAQEEALGRPYLELLPKGKSLYAAEQDGRQLRGQIIPLLLEALKADEITEGKVRDLAKRLSLSRAETETLLTLGESTS